MWIIDHFFVVQTKTFSTYKDRKMHVESFILKKLRACLEEFMNELNKAYSLIRKWLKGIENGVPNKLLGGTFKHTNKIFPKPKPSNSLLLLPIAFFSLLHVVFASLPPPPWCRRPFRLILSEKSKQELEM